MRAPGFWGLASAIALVSAGSPVAADSARAGSTMTTGVAPSGGRAWGNVPNAPLNPPVAQPGGWGPGGWHGGANGPGPNGPGPGGPGPVAGGPPPGGPGQPGGWNGGRPGGSHGSYAGRYPRVGRGHILPRFWLSPQYFVSDWDGYGLGEPGYGQNWVRYYDDALLVDGYGRVLDERDGIDWDGGYGERGGYAGGGYGYEEHGHGYGRGSGYYEHRDGNVIVHSGGGGGTVVVVQGAPIVTTTTTTYDEVVSYPRRKVWHAKRKVWRPRPRCGC